MNIEKFRVYPFENLGWLSWLNILDFIHIYSLKPRLVRMNIEKFWVYSFENLGWLSWLNILDFIHIYSLEPRLVRMDIEKPRLGELVKLEQI